MRLMSTPAAKPLVALTGLALLLAGCTTAMPAEETPAIGIPFNEQVKQGYVRLASAQWEGVDAPAAWHFRDKARAAMIGDTVWPDKVGSYDIPETHRPAALELRERLVATLEANGRITAPEQAAVAQVNFDCWLEELASDPQSQAAVACRDAFVAALEETENSLVPREPFVVFFPGGGTELDDRAGAVIAAAAETIDMVDPTGVAVLGYTDLVGPEERNLELSRQRAEAVANALIDAGVATELIQVEPRGEAAISPISAENRRVEIVVVQ